MEKDLLVELGFESVEKGEKEEEEGDDSEDETYEDCIDYFEDLKTQMKDLQLHIEDDMKEQLDVSMIKLSNNDNEQLKEKISATSQAEKQNRTEGECKEIDEAVIVENVTTNQEQNELASCNLSSEVKPDHTQEQTVSNAEDEAVSTKNCFDTRSVWSTSTASTIPPHVIKRRVKLELDKRDKKSQSKKIVVKGEASAVTRVRRDNRATIKESTGIWGWE